MVTVSGKRRQMVTFASKEERDAVMAALQKRYTTTAERARDDMADKRHLSESELMRRALRNQANMSNEDKHD